MLPMRHCGFGRHRFARPSELLVGGGGHGPNKACLLALAICLGLAAFSSVAFPQEQPISRGLSSGLDLSTQAPFRTWRITTIGSYKGVNAYRDALDAAKIKIGDAADEILGRPAPAGGRILRGVRSLGPTAVSASSISRFGLCLDLGNGAGSSAASDDCPLGAGSAAGSAVPSMTSAASPARAASMVWMSSMACSISSSLIALTPPLCSTFVSRGTSNASILRYTPGWLRALLLNFRHQGKKAIENELLVQQMTRAVPVAVRCSPCTTNLEIGDRHGSPNFKRK